MYQEEASNDPPIVSVSLEAPLTNETTVASTFSPVFAPVINVSPVISPTISPSQSNAQTPQVAPIEEPIRELPAKPITHSAPLDVTPEMLPVSYDDLQACWKENYYDGKHALILWVMNPIAPIGASGRTTPPIASHLTLRAKDGSNATIPRAYWLNVQENEVVLDVGHRAGVIIGYAENPLWIVHENPYKISPFDSIFADPFCFVGPKHQINRATPISVGIAIISTYEGKTLFRKEFEIHFTPKGVTVWGENEARI